MWGRPVRCTHDQGTRLILTKLQHDITREVIGCVFLIPEHRYLEEVERRVAHLVSKDIESLTNECILCPSSGALGQVEVFVKGGSGSVAV
jgi:hypothetical protein